MWHSLVRIVDIQKGPLNTEKSLEMHLDVVTCSHKFGAKLLKPPFGLWISTNETTNHGNKMNLNAREGIFHVTGTFR